tara:strand:- start:16 stop:354 length:339 start_codon:yes stop_codon:yes gene_type:complete
MIIQDLVEQAKTQTDYRTIKDYSRVYEFFEEELETFAELVCQNDRAARGAVLRKQDEQIKEMQLTNARLFEKFNQAVLAEREACAKLCDDIDTPDGWSTSSLSASIRARGNE